MALGSIRLRGGIDANPTLLPGGRASAFTGVEAAFAVGRANDATHSKAGLTGEFQHTEYSLRGLDPSDRAKVALETENGAIENWSLKAGTSAENTRTYNLRSFDAAQNTRVQWTGGALQPFLFAEVRYTTLNETNAILTDFLPEDQRFLRGTVIPGVTVKAGAGEFGASVSLLATRYAQEPDLFGYRRNNERIQPFLFYRFSDATVSFNASVSQLRGTWHDPDFSNVRTVLFDVSLGFKAKDNPWSLDLSGKRNAEETSFPVSPIVLSETYAGKLTFTPEDRWSVSALARWRRVAYLDSPFSTSLFAYGLAATYRLDGDWSVGAELLRINSVALNGGPADGGIITVSLARKFEIAAEKIKRTAMTPSYAQTGSPSRDSMPAPASLSAIY